MSFLVTNQSDYMPNQNLGIIALMTHVRITYVQRNSSKLSDSEFVLAFQNIKACKWLLFHGQYFQMNFVLKKIIVFHSKISWSLVLTTLMIQYVSTSTVVRG